MNQEMFYREAEKLNILMTPKIKQAFEDYAQLLIETNKAMNLTAITEIEEIYEKHFFDSLLIVPAIKEAKSLCDVGSGAGFPGMVIAIVCPNIKVVLLEPTLKRCNFLNTVKNQLKLENVEVINQRAEDFGKREHFDVVCARAVAQLNILAELCLPLVKVSGIFVAMKGSKGLEELEQAQKAISLLSGEVLSSELSLLSDESLRYNIIIKKIKSTPMKYPRSYGAIKKRPL